MASTSASPRVRPAKRRLNDSSSQASTNPNNAIETIDIAGDLHEVVDDSTKYVALIVPKSLLPAIKAFLEQATVSDVSHKKSHQAEVHHIDDIPVETLEEKQSKFLKDYGELSDGMFSTLRGYQEDELKQKVPTKDFESFKNHRRELTKWFNTCQHLKNRLINSSQSNQFLKMRYDISPAVEDSGARDSCIKKLKNVKDSCESTLTHSVLDKAINLNDGVKGFFSMCEGNPADEKLFMKAFRVVSRTNRRFDAPPKTFRNPSTRFTRNGDFRNRQRKSFRPPFRKRVYTRNEDLDDFPPPRRQNFNYRRFKRRPTYYQEDDDVFDDNDNDQPFRRSRPFRRRAFRNQNYRY